MKNITKDNRGITLVTLIVTIIIMLILLSVTTYTGIDSYKNSRISKFVIQMQLLQAKIDDLASTKTYEEVDNLGLQTGDAYQNIINDAYTNQEISSNDATTYKVFSKNDVLNILDVEGIENDILVNFHTREIVDSVGVNYNEKIYYTQYKLPGGQTVINNNIVSRDLSFELKESINGLNCSITIDKVSIINGTLSYTETDSQGNRNNWQTITNYTEKDNIYMANISKSGNYTFKLQDNADVNNNFEQAITITVTNKPKTSLSLDSYNYGGEDSDTWAYAQKNSDYYVWIPRFAYKTNTEIKFIKGNSNIATDNTYIDNTWTIHDKFTTSNGVELTGIWVNVGSRNIKGLDMIELLDSNVQTLTEIE